MSVDEYFDLVDENNNPTGERKHRKLVHRDGDWHRAVHVWLYVIDSGELLLQQRSEFKESWASLWDISVAGHISAGEGSLLTAIRETQEELGLEFPKEAFELLFTFKQESTDHGGKFVNNEFDDVYLISVKERIPLEAFVLDEAEVDAVKYMPIAELAAAYRRNDPSLVPVDMDSPYRQLFDILENRIARRAVVGSGSYTFFHKKREVMHECASVGKDVARVAAVRMAAMSCKPCSHGTDAAWHSFRCVGTDSTLQACLIVQGHDPVQIQCFTFDETYLKLIPAASR